MLLYHDPNDYLVDFLLLSQDASNQEHPSHPSVPAFWEEAKHLRDESKEWQDRFLAKLAASFTFPSLPGNHYEWVYDQIAKWDYSESVIESLISFLTRKKRWNEFVDNGSQFVWATPEKIVNPYGLEPDYFRLGKAELEEIEELRKTYSHQVSLPHGFHIKVASIYWEDVDASFYQPSSSVPFTEKPGLHPDR